MKKMKEVLFMSKTQRITFISLGAALTFVATFFIRIPTGLGYVNAGDGVIILCGAFLGGLPGLICGCIGSALADLAAGYVVYAPVTAVIKGLMGLVSGLMLSKKRPIPFLRTLLASALCLVIMVSGYFLFEGLLYGFGAAALSIIPNCLQGLCGMAIALIGTKLKIIPSRKP